MSTRNLIPFLLYNGRMKKEELKEEMKQLALKLSEIYNTNLRIEINVNPKYDSAKVNITEYDNRGKNGRV